MNTAPQLNVCAPKTHVGYAARTAEKFRYERDPNEVILHISAELADKVLDSINAHPDCAVNNSAVEQLERVLVNLLGREQMESPKANDIRLFGSPLTRIWKPGERVNAVSRPDGPYGGESLRPGVVVSIDEELRRHQRLRVRFDDGEERYINPDVMRHERSNQA